MPESKVWGFTECLYLGPYSETHVMTVNPGYVCSCHCHKAKHNYFHVVSGHLKVHLFLNETEKHPYETYNLRDGQSLSIKPGVLHQFESVDVVCKVIEIYYVDELVAGDIQRHGLGHKVEVATSLGSV